MNRILFAYGSIKSGEHNHRVLKTGDNPVFNKSVPATIHGQIIYEYCRPERSGVPDEARSLYDHKQGIPVLHTELEGTVIGEVFFMNEEDFEQNLKRLDQLEGFYGEGKDKQNTYERVERDVILENGEVVKAFVYVAPESIGKVSPWRMYAGASSD
jgi:gamma-glutamylcyclotransferase (GGCT)/AIG2-like uncharacterized protein YtfP